MERDRAANALPTRKPEDDIPPISFSNLVAVRACYWNAVIAALFSNLPWTAGLSFLWFLSAGLFSVAAYRRRTGLILDVRDGLRLGRIAGAITFAMWLVLFSVQVMALEGGFSTVIEEQARVMREAGQTEQADMLEEAAGEPTALALGLLLAIVLVLGLTVGLASLGGALGAKILARRRAP